MDFDDYSFVFIPNQEREQLSKTLPDIETRGEGFYLPRHIDLKRIAESFAQTVWFLHACDSGVARPQQWMFLRDCFAGPHYRRFFDWNFIYQLYATYLPFRGMDTIGIENDSVMYIDSDPMERFENCVPVEDATFDGIPSLKTQAVNFKWQGIWQFYDDSRPDWWKNIFGDVALPNPFMFGRDIRNLYKLVKKWDKDLYVLQTNRGYAQWGRTDSPFMTPYSSDKLHKKIMTTTAQLEQRETEMTGERFGWDADTISYHQRLYQVNSSTLPSGETDPSGLYNYKYTLTHTEFEDLADDKFQFFFPIPKDGYGETLKHIDVLFVFKVKKSSETYYTSSSGGVGTSDGNSEYEKTIVAKVRMTKGNTTENFVTSAGDSWGRCQEFYMPESTYRQIIDDILENEGWVDVNNRQLDLAKHQNVPGIIMMKTEDMYIDLKGTYVCTKWHGSFDMSSWTPSA